MSSTDSDAWFNTYKDSREIFFNEMQYSTSYVNLLKGARRTKLVYLVMNFIEYHCCVIFCGVVLNSFEDISFLKSVDYFDLIGDKGFMSIMST